MAGVHCAKCHIKTLSILFHTALLPSRKSLMPSGEQESHFWLQHNFLVNRYQQRNMKRLQERVNFIFNPTIE